jgi:hypothetical protein
LQDRLEAKKVAWRLSEGAGDGAEERRPEDRAAETRVRPPLGALPADQLRGDPRAHEGAHRQSEERHDLRDEPAIDPLDDKETDP